MTDEKADQIREQCTGATKRRLTAELPETSLPKEEILRILQQQLSERDVEVLKEGLKDYRPGADQP